MTRHHMNKFLLMNKAYHLIVFYCFYIFHACDCYTRLLAVVVPMITQ